MKKETIFLRRNGTVRFKEGKLQTETNKTTKTKKPWKHSYNLKKWTQSNVLTLSDVYMTEDYNQKVEDNQWDGKKNNNTILYVFHFRRWWDVKNYEQNDRISKILK